MTTLLGAGFLGPLLAGLTPAWGQAPSTATVSIQVKPNQGPWDPAFFGYNRELMELIRQGTEGAAAAAAQGGVQVQGAGGPPAAPAAAPADPAFRLGEVFTYPNPARAGAKPVFHVEVGVADRVRIRVYDVAGRAVHEAAMEQAPEIKDMGAGPRYAYEHAWDGRIASGVYFYVVEAEKAGMPRIRKAGRMAVVR